MPAVIGLVVVCVGIVAIVAVSGGGKTSTTAMPPELKQATVAAAQPAPSLAELVQHKKDYTDAQWDAYAKGLEGKRIDNWEGVVQNVDNAPLSDDRFIVTIDVKEPESGDPAFDLRFELPQADAVKLGKGQNITTSGVIDSVDCVLTYCPIRLMNANYSLK